MKKRTTSNQVAIFILLAIVVGFAFGRLWPNETRTVYLGDSSVTDVVNDYGSAVVSVVANSSPTGLEATAGSGFIVSGTQQVVTSAHVVDDPEADYSVILQDGRIFAVGDIKKHPINDLAMLTLLESDDLPSLELGDSDIVQAGQTVVAIGMNLSQNQISVSTGVISSVGRSIQASGLLSAEDLPNVIETDAAIHPGNSGGPLLNLNGEVIGVNVALDTTNGLLSFAIPSNEVKDLIMIDKTM